MLEITPAPLRLTGKVEESEVKPDHDDAIKYERCWVAFSIVNPNQDAYVATLAARFSGLFWETPLLT